MRFRVEIADPQLRIWLQHTCQLSDCALQKAEVAYGKRTDCEVKDRRGKRELQAIRPGELTLESGFLASDIQHSRRGVDSYGPSARVAKFLEPASRATCQIKHSPAMQAWQQRQEITLFADQQGIGGLIIGQGPALIGLCDGKRSIRWGAISIPEEASQVYPLTTARLRLR